MERIETELLVVGGNLAGLSVAIQAREAGVERVLVLEPGEQVVAPDVIGQFGLSVRFRAPVNAIASDGPDRITAGGEGTDVVAALVAIAFRPPRASRPFPVDVAESISETVHLLPPTIDLSRHDVLVVGDGEEAADYAVGLATSGANVVLALGGGDVDALSRLARRQLLRLEAERRATIFWNSTPVAIEDVAGFPMVDFGDRRTPDLQFDHVVFRQPLANDETALSSWEVELAPSAPPRVYLIDPGAASDKIPVGVEVVAPGPAWERIRADHFPDLAAPSVRPRIWRTGDRDQIEELRSANYNATITWFERSHSDLWVLRVRPDHGDTFHLAGQYASLGLGYWEPRADVARDHHLDRLWGKLIRRSYSISSPLLDPSGYIYDPCRSTELEFYIVLVPPALPKVPALTPRLGLKGVGDRMYLGPKVAGRYTLARVVDPDRRLVFLATGTGEAPHNSMIAELLRKGHRGPILSAVSVRYQDDLGYREQHRQLENRYQQYHYLPLVTRDPGLPKLYIQDAINNGGLEELLGAALDPTTTDVYLCGNPLMIGLADEEGRFPSPTGVCELLTNRGFTVDRRGVVGNVHYEEYW